MNGAGKLRTIGTVTLPLLRPALLSAWSLLFVFATREVNEAVILSGPKSRPLAVLAWNYVEQGSIRNAGLDPENLPDSDPSKMNVGGDAKKAWKDIWGCGQGIGAVKEVVPARVLVARLKREFLSGERY